MTGAQFDEYSENYEQALQRGISVSGEDSLYFANGRLSWLSQRLKAMSFQPQAVLDFGCGVGNSLPIIQQTLGAKRIAGIDISADSIRMARQRFDEQSFELAELDQLRCDGSFDLVFCNGVFHHIPPDQRLASAVRVFNHLRAGGLFAYFENNPLNPGTRYVMSRIPFDRDAITLTPWQSRRLLRQAGFEIVRTDYLFYFPKLLAVFRPLEPWLSHLPLGAQYLVLCRKV